MPIAVRTLASPADWEACKAVRFEVFVDEQAVPAELELDEHDGTARHWLAVDGEAAVATARVVVKPGGTWKIGRVAVRKPWRGQGVGAAVMAEILADARAAGAPEAVLESQTHAMPFYAKLGFVAEGEEYLDCGIPHYMMRLPLDQDL